MNNSTILSCETPQVFTAFPPWYTIPINVVMVVLYTLIITAALIGNGVMCIAVYVNATLRRAVASYFIVSLALSDIGTACLSMPFDLETFTTFGCWHRGEALCIVWTTAYLITVPTSILNLFVLSIDRYNTLKDPWDKFKDSPTITPRRAALVIAVLWIYSLVFALVPVLGVQYYGPQSVLRGLCIFNVSPITSIVNSIVNFYLPMFAMCWIYYRIYQIAHTQYRMPSGLVETETSISKTTSITNPAGRKTSGILRSQDFRVGEIHVSGVKNDHKQKDVYKERSPESAGSMGLENVAFELSESKAKTSEILSEDSRHVSGDKDEAERSRNFSGDCRDFDVCGKLDDGLEVGTFRKERTVIVNTSSSKSATTKECQGPVSEQSQVCQCGEPDNSQGKLPQSIKGGKERCDKDVIRKDKKQSPNWKGSLYSAIRYERGKNIYLVKNKTFDDKEQEEGKIDNNDDANFNKKVKEMRKREAFSRKNDNSATAVCLRATSSADNVTQAQILAHSASDEGEKQHTQNTNSNITTGKEESTDDLQTTSPIKTRNENNLLEITAVETSFAEDLCTSEQLQELQHDQDLQHDSPVGRVTYCSPVVHRDKLLSLTKPKEQEGGISLERTSSDASGHAASGKTLNRSSGSIHFLRNRRFKVFVKNTKAARTISIIVSAFLICWVPFTTLSVVNNFCLMPCYRAIPPEVIHVFLLMGYLNSALNPLLFTYQNPHFRRAYRNIVRALFSCTRV